MRFYRLLLHLYPASFRHEYGDEMAAVFAARRRDTGNAGARAALLLSAIGEVATNASLVHADILRQDVHYVARTLRRAPGFATMAVLIAALGIGATTAAFSVTDFVLLRPLPFPDADGLVKVWQTTPAATRIEVSPPNYRDWTSGSRSFAHVGAYLVLATNMIGRHEPQRLYGASFTFDLIPALGVQPLVGRVFDASDVREGAASTVLLSYRLWQTEFDGNPAVVGQSVALDNLPHTIIGVMPLSSVFHRTTRSSGRRCG